MNVVTDGQYNIGHICTRQQCDAGRSEKVALRWITNRDHRADYTFMDLENESNVVANSLRNIGCSAGDVLFVFLPRCPELFFTILGSLKLNLICCPLFSSFGDDALLDRLGDAKAKVILTNKNLLRKVLRIRDRLPSLHVIIVTDIDTHQSSEILSYPQLRQESSHEYTTPATSPETPSILHYTSGSTGKPKGVLHVHRSILHQTLTTSEILGLGEHDLFWCTADPGWVTGTTYGIIGPWSLGITQIHYEGGFEPSRWLDLLQGERITVWYTAPTALRMLMREEPSFFAGYDLSTLQRIFSVGEPLNPEVLTWGRRVLNKEIYDTWFQTETGGIMISNHPGLPVREGSMGKPVRGITAAIISDEGEIVEDGREGNLSIRTGWPSMFVTYLHNHEAYESRFRNGYYVTGDIAFRDTDGYLWFKGRSDDVINTAGHLVSPFEVESALIELSEIAESGVIAAPDAILHEKVVAYVVLHRGMEWSSELELKIRLHVSKRISTYATPQEILVVERLPKNKSGKIMRRVLKSRYMGLETGDLSTLED